MRKSRNAAVQSTNPGSDNEGTATLEKLKNAAVMTAEETAAMLLAAGRDAERVVRSNRSGYGAYAGAEEYVPQRAGGTYAPATTRSALSAVSRARCTTSKTGPTV
jgi:hypothetical protein